MATMLSFPLRSPSPSPSPSSSFPASKFFIRSFSNFNFNSYSTSITTQINHHLTTILPMHNYPQSLHNSMQNSVLNLNLNLNYSNGHHFLPVLTIASCELVGGDRNTAIATACAMQIAHAASHLHEKQSGCISSNYEQGLALLTGDALFFRSFECVVGFTPLELVQDFIVQQVVSEISKCFGSIGVTGGMSMEVSCEEEMVWMLKRKFGSMTECSAVCGGLIGGAGEDVLRRLRKYGMAVGVWKQVMSEIKLGFDEERSDLVKVVGKERAMEMEEEFKKEAMRELKELEEMYGERVAPLHCMLEMNDN